MTLTPRVNRPFQGYDMGSPEPVGVMSLQGIGETGMRIASVENGRRLFISQFFNNELHQFDLGDDCVISSGAVKNPFVLTLSPTAGPVAGLIVARDGSAFYTVSTQNTRIHKYSLRLPWQLRGAVYDGPVFDYSALISVVADFSWGDNERRLYITGRFPRSVVQFDLDVPSDPSSAMHVSTLPYNISGGALLGQYNATGTRFMFFHAARRTVQQYWSYTPWQADTLSVTFQDLWDWVPYLDADRTLNSCAFSDDGEYCYIHDRSSQFIYQFRTNRVLARCW